VLVMIRVPLWSAGFARLCWSAPVRVFASLAVLLLALVGIVSVHRAQVAPAAPVPVPEPKAKGEPVPDAATTLRIPFAQGAPGLDPQLCWCTRPNPILAIDSRDAPPLH
jgi:hypothetical protein